MAFYDIDAYTIKLANQSILMIIFSLTLFTFLVHIIFRLRYRYSWHRISSGVNENSFLHLFLRKNFRFY